MSRNGSGLRTSSVHRRRAARKISRACLGKMEMLESRVMLTTVTWSSATSGNWNQASNWSNDSVPTAADDVVIAQPGVTVTVTASEAANSVTVAGGASPSTLEIASAGLTVSANSQINGGLLIDGGALTNGGTFTLAGSASFSNGSFSGGVWNITTSGTLTLSTDNYKDLDGGVVLNNSGTIIDNGTEFWRFYNDSSINNLSGGLVDMNGSEYLQDQSSGGSAFNNESGATFENTGPGSATTVPFDNQPGATISVQTGTFDIDAGSSTGGIFDVASGATLDVTGGNSTTMSGSYTGSGAGTVLMESGVLNIGASGATFDFPSGLFDWSGGQINGAAGGALDNTGDFTLTSDSYKDSSSLILNNSGLITDDGSEYWRFFGDSMVNNLANGVADMNSSEDLQDQSSGGSAFNNESGAIFEKTGASNSLTTVPFYNMTGGVVDIDEATFYIDGGGNSTNGPFNVQSGATLDLTDGNVYTLSGSFTGSGGGTVSLEGGTLNIGAAGATFSFPTGMFVWSGGTISGADGGALDNTGDITLTTGNYKDMNDGLILNNSGTITDDGTEYWRFFGNSTVNNLANAVVDMNSSEDLQDQSSGGSAFNNESGATFENTDGADFTTVPFHNQPGATILVTSNSFTLDAGSSTGGSFNVAAGADLDLTGGYTYTLSGTYSGTGSGTVSLSGGTIQLAGTGVTFNFPTGMFVWSDGTIAGAAGAPLDNIGDMTLTTGNYKDMSGGLILNNSGTITDNGTQVWRFFGDSMVNNLSGALVDLNGTESLQDQSSGGSAFNNEPGATFENTGGSNYTTVPFFNQPGATIQVVSGAFALDAGSSSGGSFNVAAGTDLDLTGGYTYTVSGNYTGTGSGTVSLSGGELQLAGTGVTFNFPAGMFVWSDGTIYGTPGATLNNTGSITLTTSNYKDMSDGLILNNSGTITDDGSQVWRFFGDSMVNNLSGGVVDLNGTESLQDQSSGNSAFNNESGATFEMTGGPDYTTVPFNNQPGATISVTTNSFSLDAGSSTGGSFNVASGADLDLTGGYSDTLSGNYSGAGSGTVSMSGGTLNIGAAGATFDFPAGMFVWSNGIVSGAAGGPWNNTGFITLTTSNYKDMYSGLILNNSGTITDDGSQVWRFFDDSMVNNLPGGVVDMASTEGLQDQSSGGSAFNNESGAVLESTGPGAGSSVPFNNLGTFQIGTGSFSFSNVTQISGTTLTGGTWIVTGTGQLTLPGGDLTQNSGTVEIGGSGSFSQINSITMNAGTFSLLGGVPVTLAGGLTNSGTVLLMPAGTLDVPGDLTLSPTSALTIDIGGAPGVAGSGELDAGGSASLNGRLTIDAASGYAPVAGQMYTVASFASSSGSFSTIKHKVDGQKVFAVSVTPSDVQATTLLTSGAFQSPTITSSNSASFSTGIADSFTITTTGTPSATISESGSLPADLTFVNLGNGQATISGTPTSADLGTYALTLTADNGVSPADTESFTLSVVTPPTITSASSYNFVTEFTGSFTITTTGSPQATISESGALPAGVVFSALGNGEATISGTPSAGVTGSFVLTLTADNGVSPAATQSFTLSVVSPPTIAQGTSGVIMVNGANADNIGTITVSNSEVTLEVDGAVQTFPLSSVTGVNVNLTTGNNNLMIGSSVPSTSIAGGSGSDTIMASNQQADTIIGGMVDDDIEVSTSAADYIQGGKSNNTLMGGGSGTIILGKAGTGMIVPQSTGEIVRGGPGIDTIESTAGGDKLKAGLGEFKVFLTGGNSIGDTILGGPGIDVAQYNPNDFMSNVLVFDPPGPSSLSPALVREAFSQAVPVTSATVASGTLEITGSNSANSITVKPKGVNLKVVANGDSIGKFPLVDITGISFNGGTGADTVSVSDSITLPATLNGGGGDDSITGGGGDNILIGGFGNATLIGGGGTSLLVPGPYETYESTLPGQDSLVGGSGFAIADFAYQTNNLDLSNNGQLTGGEIIAPNVLGIWGGTGQNTITGTSAGDFLSGGGGKKDSLAGQAASDLLVASSGGKNQVAVGAEPVSLDSKNGVSDTISGLNSPSVDILNIDQGIDSITA
ncbi:MAG TPA: hypothetical protein VL992_02040 [Tepidisphaeraceae bacterium]|nr:hypothetical protein [Tepidisphaeraceae bacterium]